MIVLIFSFKLVIRRRTTAVFLEQFSWTKTDASTVTNIFVAYNTDCFKINQNLQLTNE